MTTFTILFDVSNLSNKGFEIQSANKGFVHWDMAQKDFFDRYHDLLIQEGTHGIKIQAPVRIGKLVFHDFFISDKFSINSYKPISSFYTQCHTLDSKALLTELIRLFENQGGIPKNSYYGKEINDFVVSTIGTMQITAPNILYADEKLEMVKIVMQYGDLKIVLSRESYTGGSFVNVVFWNSKNISYFFKEDYKKYMQASQHIILNEEKLSLASCGSLDVETYLHKIELELNNDVMIWRDDVNACIGFIGQNQIHILDWNEISFFSITNIDDGRIGYYSEFKVHFSIKNRDPICLLSYTGSPGKVDFFDDKMKTLKDIIQKEIVHKGYLT